MKQPVPPPTRGTKFKRRKKLTRFGEFVKAARETKIPSQQKAAQVLTDHDLKVSQSFTAQLETGRLTDPDPEVLRKIGTAYGIDYDHLVFALIRDKYRLDDEAFLPPLSRQRWKTLEALLPRFPSVGAVEELELDQLRAKQSALAQEMLDLQGLAKWRPIFRS